MNVSINQRVQVTKLGTEGTVVKVGSRTCSVKLDTTAEILKFVLSDGRQSGAGYDCPYIVELGESYAPPQLPFEFEDVTTLELEFESTEQDPSPEVSEICYLLPEFYEQKLQVMMLAQPEVKEVQIVDHPECGDELTFEFHGPAGCDVFGIVNYEVFQKVMEPATARLFVKYLNREKN
jgi:hypothetical protein